MCLAGAVEGEEEEEESEEEEEEESEEEEDEEEEGEEEEEGQAEDPSPQFIGDPCGTSQNTNQPKLAGLCWCIRVRYPVHELVSGQTDNRSDSKSLGRPVGHMLGRCFGPGSTRSYPRVPHL